MSGAWEAITAEQLAKDFIESFNFVVLREQVLSGEVLLADTPKEFQERLAAEEAQETRQRDHEKLVRETVALPCPLCKREAIVARESGPHEMGGSPDWQAVSCYHCGLLVRKHDMLEAKILWNRLPR